VLVSYCHWDDPDCNEDYYKNSKERYKIDKIEMYLSIILFNYDFNPFLYEKSQAVFIQEIYSYLNVGFFKTTDIKISTKNLITDDGFILPNKNTKVINIVDTIENNEQQLDFLDNYLLRLQFGHQKRSIVRLDHTKSFNQLWQM